LGVIVNLSTSALSKFSRLGLIESLFEFGGVLRYLLYSGSGLLQA
jgi:hypothetical protein